jgi:hypothetical protein
VRSFDAYGLWRIDRSSSLRLSVTNLGAAVDRLSLSGFTSGAYSATTAYGQRQIQLAYESAFSGFRPDRLITSRLSKK